MYIKIKCGGQFFIVKICDEGSEQFTPNGILLSIVEKLNLEVDGREINFKDRDGAEIEFDELAGVISQYKYSSSFFVEFCFDEATSTNTTDIKKELESYLRNGDFAAIFNEYAAKKTLKDSSRRCLVREAINFLRKRSGNYPKREDKIALAEAVIHLFPSYKVENSNCGGIDLFFNPETNTGYFVAKLKNFNTKRRKLSTAKPETTKQEGDSSSDDENISEGDLHFFQNCLVSEQLLTIKEKLQQTLKARIKYCSANVLKDFPIFLFDSSLILFDFELRFEEKKSNELCNNWDKYKKYVSEILNEAGGKNLEGLGDWAFDILPFSHLLMLLPSTAAGRDTKRAKIYKSVDSFITFEELHTPIEEYKVGSQQPTIVAVGENKSSISQNFLSLDGKCINVPTNFNFLQYIYKIDNKKTTSTRLVEVNSKFQHKFNTFS